VTCPLAFAHQGIGVSLRRGRPRANTMRGFSQMAGTMASIVSHRQASRRAGDRVHLVGGRILLLVGGHPHILGGAPSRGFVDVGWIDRRHEANLPIRERPQGKLIPKIEVVNVDGPSSLRIRSCGKCAEDIVDVSGWIATGGDLLAPLKDLRA
jgi:hypothetical protein